MHGHAEMKTKKSCTVEPLLFEIKTETQLIAQVSTFINDMFITYDKSMYMTLASHVYINMLSVKVYCTFSIPCRAITRCTRNL